MSQHPRYKHFPWHGDYSAQPNLYSPYAVSVAQPGYHSKSLNIDDFGFRYQYDFDEKLIDLKTARDTYDKCTLLLGNSTAFGVSLTADNKTLGHYLNQKDVPCISLSVRGATVQQELSVYLAHKHLLPCIDKIVILTGVCDVSLATQPEDFWVGGIGAVHCIETFYKQHYNRIAILDSDTAKAKQAFLDWAEDRYHKTQWLQKIFKRRIEKSTEIETPTHDKFNSNLEYAISCFENVLQTWGWIKSATQMDVHFVIQPVLGWTTKKPSQIEHECISADLLRIPAINMYANPAIYKKIVSSIESLCKKNGIAFHDANSFFDQLNQSETLFSDICHLTDLGTSRLAEFFINLNRSDSLVGTC